MLIVIYLIFIVAIFYWQAQLVRAGKSTKGKSIGLHLAYTAAPIMLYGAVFFALVGIEELTDKAIIREGYARSLLFVIVGGLSVSMLATLIFSFVVAFMKQRNVNAT